MSESSSTLRKRSASPSDSRSAKKQKTEEEKKQEGVFEGKIGVVGREGNVTGVGRSSRIPGSVGTAVFRQSGRASNLSSTSTSNPNRSPSTSPAAPLSSTPASHQAGSSKPEAYSPPPPTYSYSRSPTSPASQASHANTSSASVPSFNRGASSSDPTPPAAAVVTSPAKSVSAASSGISASQAATVITSHTSSTSDTFPPAHTSTLPSAASTSSLNITISPENANVAVKASSATINSAGSSGNAAVVETDEASSGGVAGELGGVEDGRDGLGVAGGGAGGGERVDGAGVGGQSGVTGTDEVEGAQGRQARIGGVVGMGEAVGLESAKVVSPRTAVDVATSTSGIASGNAARTSSLASGTAGSGYQASHHAPETHSTTRSLPTSASPVVAPIPAAAAATAPPPSLHAMPSRSPPPVTPPLPSTPLPSAPNSPTLPSSTNAPTASVIPPVPRPTRTFHPRDYSAQGSERLPVRISDFFDGIFDFDFKDRTISNNWREVTVYQYFQVLVDEESAPGRNRSGLWYIFPHRLPAELAEVVCGVWRTVNPHSSASGPNRRTKHIIFDAGPTKLIGHRLRDWMLRTRAIDSSIFGYTRHIDNSSRRDIWHCYVRPVKLFVASATDASTNMPSNVTVHLERGPLDVQVVGRPATDLLGPSVREFERIAKAAELWAAYFPDTSFEILHLAFALDDFGSSALTGDAQFSAVASQVVAEEVMRGNLNENAVRWAIDDLLILEQNAHMVKAIVESVIPYAFRRRDGVSPRIVPTTVASHHVFGSVFEKLNRAFAHKRTLEVGTATGHSRYEVNTVAMRRFADRLGFKPSPYYHIGDIPAVRPDYRCIAALTSSAQLPNDIQRDARLIDRELGSPRSASGDVVPDVVWQIALGHVAWGQRAVGEQLVDLLVRWGYKELSRIIRLRLEEHTDRHGVERPADWIHRSSTRIFATLHEVVGRGFGGWRDLKFSHIRQAYPTLCATVDFDGYFLGRRVPLQDHRLIPFCVVVGLVAYGNLWNQTREEDGSTANTMAFRLVRRAIDIELAGGLTGGGGVPFSRAQRH